MSIKKTVLTLVCFSFFASILAGNVLAEDGYCSGVVVNYAGVYSPISAKVVHLTNPSNTCGNWTAGTSMFFLLDSSTGQDNAMLAAALTAQGSGTTVLAFPVDGASGGNYSNWSTLVGIYAASATAPAP